MRINWNQDKNNLLKESRGVSFEQVEEEILKGDFIGLEKHPARENQMRRFKLSHYLQRLNLKLVGEGEKVTNF